MCFILFIATRTTPPSRPFSTENSVSNPAPVRNILSLPLVSSTGCACAYRNTHWQGAWNDWVDPDPPPKGEAEHKALAEHLRGLLRSEPIVELYFIWAHDWDRPDLPLHREEISFSKVAQWDFVFRSPGLYRIFPSEP
jgi:hypothetical protein